MVAPPDLSLICPVLSAAVWLWGGWAVLVSRALGKGGERGARSIPLPMSLGLEGSLEAQLALEEVIQVGPGGCAH